MSIKVGDIVELKSGGPQMTVGEIILQNYAACTWYENGEVKTTKVPLAVLNKVE